MLSINFPPKQKGLCLKSKILKFTEKYWTDSMWKVQDTSVISSSFERERKEPDSYQEHAPPRESDILLTSLHY